MKILMISNMYPSKSYPNYGSFVANVEKTLKKKFEVETIYITKTNNLIMKIIKYIIFYVKVIILSCYRKYDLIYAHYASHTAFPLLIIKKIIPSRKIIINVHGNDIIPESKKDEKYLPLVKKILLKSTAIISPSEYFSNILKKEYNIDAKKIFIYPSGGVDTKIFKKINKNDACMKLNIDTKYNYIGYVGRIEINKGWDIFLKACKKITDENKNVRLIVVGNGSEKQEFKKLIENLNLSLKVNWLDFMPQENLPYLYNILNVFVFPTYRKSESLGLVGLEAMSCEVKTVLPDAYGPSSYGINNFNSFVFESKNENDLSKKIKLALSYNKNDIQKNARETALKYDINNINDSFMNFIKEIEGSYE